MDNRENVEYFERLKQVQNILSENIKQVVMYNFNYFIDKYGGWKRYPRKIKKKLKRNPLWNCRNCNKIEENKLRVIYNV